MDSEKEVSVPLVPLNQGPQIQAVQYQQPIQAIANYPNSGFQQLQQAGQPAVILQPQPYGAPTLAQTGINPLSSPRGFEALIQLDRLILKQEIDMVQMGIGCKAPNRYRIMMSNGQDVYKAKEISDCCARQCCGPKRSFGMAINDFHGNEVIHLERPKDCGTCCNCSLYCCNSIEVHSPPGTIIGTIQQDCNWPCPCCRPEFIVKDASGTPILRIEASRTAFCPFICCEDVNFEIFSISSGENIGRIQNKFPGFLQCCLRANLNADADNFSISFPLDLDVKVKATLLGALMLFDFMYFSNTQY